MFIIVALNDSIFDIVRNGTVSVFVAYNNMHLR